MKGEKYTKKASARILKEVLKFQPKSSVNTSYNQAFEILMEEWDLTLGIETHNKTKNTDTICTLYKDDEIATTWTLQNIWDEKNMDWDWNTLYKTVMEDIIKRRLYKRPKTPKRLKKEEPAILPTETKAKKSTRTIKTKNKAV